MFQVKIDIPSASEINYKDADEICGYQLLLCKMFEREGGLNYPATSNRMTLSIKREGIVWLHKVKDLISDILSGSIDESITTLNLGDIPLILDSYEFFYRICHGIPCYSFIRETVLQSANRYIKGDKSLSQAQLALMLLQEADRDVRSMEHRYLTFSGKVMEKWINNLEMNGKLEQVSQYDSYDILKYLLHTNLFAFGVKTNSKLRWIDMYSLPNTELDLLDTKVLWRYIGFDQAAAYINGKSLEEQDAQYVSLFSKIITREDLHPFFREALTIDLSKYKTA